MTARSISKPLAAIKNDLSITMNLLFKIKNLFIEEKPKVEERDEVSYIKTWLDDECQIQLLPEENEKDVTILMNNINDIHSTNDNKNGFAQTIERGKFNFPLLEKRISQKDLELLFEKHKIEKVEFIERELGSKLPYSDSSEKAHKCTYKFIFDLKGKYIDQFWIIEHLIVSTRDFNKIESFLHEFATKYNLILVDWNSLEIIKIKDLEILRSNLMNMFK